VAYLQSKPVALEILPTKFPFQIKTRVIQNSDYGFNYSHFFPFIIYNRNFTLISQSFVVIAVNKTETATNTVILELLST